MGPTGCPETSVSNHLTPRNKGSRCPTKKTLSLFKRGKTGSPETSVPNHPTQHNNPEDERIQHTGISHKLNRSSGLYDKCHSVRYGSHSCTTHSSSDTITKSCYTHRIVCVDIHSGVQILNDLLLLTSSRRTEKRCVWVGLQWERNLFATKRFYTRKTRTARYVYEGK
jgi:hypothetical protein